MTNEQKVLFDLLVEVKNICEENNIDMYLSEALMLDACKNSDITGTYHDFTVFIHSKDINKLIAAASKKENRFVESLLNNPKFPGVYLKYVKEDSLYYNIDEHSSFEHNGFAINIKILRNAPKNAKIAKVYDVIETGLGPLNKKTFSIKKIVGSVFNVLFLVMGPRGRGKFVFNLINDTKGKDAKSKGLHGRIYKKKAKFNKKAFAELKEISLCGETFRIPADEEYFYKVIDNVDEKNFMPTMAAEYIIDKDICYKEFFAECKKQNFPKSFYRKKFKLLVMNGVISFYRRDIRKCWNLLYRTRDRFELWEKYMPLKAEIIDLYKNEKWTELEAMLSEFIEIIAVYARKRMGIAFDPEIFDITIELLKHRGRNELAEKAKKYMPKEYLIPLSEDLGIE